MNKNIIVADRKDRIFESILNYFKGALTDGTIKPGDRLLPERELAALFNVSRASLREVLKALEMLGLLSVIPGKGTFVLAPETNTLTGLMGMILTLRPAISKDIVEVRKMIECEAVRLSCSRASPEELSNIKSSLKKMRVISNKEKHGLEAANADFEFHEGIIKATHNSFLIFMYGALETLVKHSHVERWTDSLRYIQNAVEVISTAHEEIYMAIVKGNESTAEELMRSHFELIASRHG